MVRNRYYIHWGDFGNIYQLRYAPASFHVPDGWERITRKKAEALAAEERWRRKHDQAFSGYADQYIFPFPMTEQDNYDFECRRHWDVEGFIAYRTR